jgi:hypothetical protein
MPDEGQPEDMPEVIENADVFESIEDPQLPEGQESAELAEGTAEIGSESPNELAEPTGDVFSDVKRPSEQMPELDLSPWDQRREGETREQDGGPKRRPGCGCDVASPDQGLSATSGTILLILLGVLLFRAHRRPRCQATHFVAGP